MVVPPAGTADVGDVLLTPETRLSGRIHDAAGHPAGDGVSVHALPCDAEVERRTSGIYYATDAEGRFTINGCGRHTYVLLAVGDGVASPAVLVDARGGDVSGIDIEASPGTRVVFTRTLLEDFDADWLADERGHPIEYRPGWNLAMDWELHLVPGRYTLHGMRDGGVESSMPIDVAGELLVVEAPR